MDLAWDLAMRRARWQMANAFAAWISPACHTHFAGMPKAPSDQSTGHNLKSTSRTHLGRPYFRFYISHLTHDSIL